MDGKYYERNSNNGYLGGEIYSRINSRKAYDLWKDILKRCNNDNFKKQHFTYKDCTICDEWHNFQNFARWYGENYYEIDNDKMCLDKDILIKGNKIYSPETCVFVNNRINVLFTKRQNCRGKYPIGVTWEKARNKYRTFCCDNNGNQKHLGLFDDVTKAFIVYKNFKEKIIKEVAEEYRERIPKNLYNAMNTYMVEITD